MSLAQQLKLLMWKNFAIRRRQKLRVIVELLWPLILFILLMLVRSKGLYLRIHQCHFEDKPLPSAGQFLFWQGLICAFNNTCHSLKSDAERSYSDLITSDLTLLMKDAQTFTEKAMNRSEARFSNLLDEIQNLADELRNGTGDNRTITRYHQFTDALKEKVENTSDYLNDAKTYLERNLEKLTNMHKNIDKRLEGIGPDMEIVELLRRINISYVNITDIIKEVPQVNEIFVRLHNFMCGNVSHQISIDMMLEPRHNVDNLRGYLNTIQDAPATIEYQYDPEASKECNAIYEHLETSTSLKFIWRYLKPFVR